MTIVKFTIPAIIVGLSLLAIIYLILKHKIKARLMKQLGYEYDEGLGSNVAREFQSHWVKDKVRINCRDIDTLAYRKIKPWVKSKENRV
ncbi:hypothetical protein D3C78_1777560 [compost metagenome]